MKDIKPVISCSEESKVVVDKIVKYVLKDAIKEDGGVSTDGYQYRVGIDPQIANAMFNRDKKVLENERFKTLISLARTITDDTALAAAIKGLGYTLTVEEKSEPVKEEPFKIVIKLKRPSRYDEEELENMIATNDIIFNGNVVSRKSDGMIIGNLVNDID